MVLCMLFLCRLVKAEVINGKSSNLSSFIINNNSFFKYE